MDEEAQPTAHSKEPGQEVRRPGRWTCRLHLWHRWRTHVYPNVDDRGGLRYQECLDCGKQRELPVGGGTWLAGQYDEDA